jgi:UDPglucose 6-dehydrogenase
MGMDGRIGSKFLHAGPGYGGSCFPKDIQALLKIGRDYGCELSIIDSTIKANDNQKLRMINKIVSTMGSVEGKTICVLGLAFKPETDDMREAPALTIIKELYKRGAVFKIYDPQAFKEAKWRFDDISDRITYCDDEYFAVKDADALVIITEWNQFRNLNLDKIRKSMKDKYFFDLRNIYNPVKVSEMGFKYYSIGRPFVLMPEVITEAAADKNS